MTPIEQRLSKLERRVNCISCETQFYENLAAFPTEGGENKIYIASDTGAQYIWDGAGYIAPTGLAPMRFGISGEDDTATENRSFDGAGFDFYITSSGIINSTTVAVGVTSFIENAGSIGLLLRSSEALQSSELVIRPSFTSLFSTDDIYINAENNLIIDIPSKGNIGDVLTSVDAGGTTEWKPRLPYKVYTALLTQTGTNAPVATVLENTLGGTLVWTFDAFNSECIGTLSGAFAGTVVFVPLADPSNGLWVIGGKTDNNSVYMRNGFDFTTFIAENDVLLDTPIEIRVYP